MNDVAPKTVVRITAPGNKSICAMVLGPLQETKGAGACCCVSAILQLLHWD
jgi:hypothetical protein